MAKSLKVFRYPANELIPFATALQLQEHLVQKKLQTLKSSDSDVTDDDYLIALQHTPTVTLGRRTEIAQVSSSDGISIVKTNRGGLATYHGPGQLTFYPIINLASRGSRVYSLRDYVGGLGITMKTAVETVFPSIENAFADCTSDRAGLWLSPTEKVGFIGIQARRCIVSHGFSLNVTKESLRGFQDIDPCGLKGQAVKITDLQTHTKDSRDPTELLEMITSAVIKSFKHHFNYKH